MRLSEKAYLAGGGAWRVPWPALPCSHPPLFLAEQNEDKQFSKA